MKNKSHTTLKYFPKGGILRETIKLFNIVVAQFIELSLLRLDVIIRLGALKLTENLIGNQEFQTE